MDAQDADGIMNLVMHAVERDELLQQLMRDSPTRLASLARGIIENEIRRVSVGRISYGSMTENCLLLLVVSLCHPNAQRVTTIWLSGVYSQAPLTLTPFLATRLRTHRYLQSLRLPGNNLGDSCMQLISSALRMNTVLTKLDLSYNNVRNKGCRIIASVLPSCSLHTLYLNGNHITDSGAQALAKALLKNNGLRVLVLYDNLIEREGIKAFVPVILNNHTIRRLRLERNGEYRVTNYWLKTASSSSLVTDIERALLFTPNTRVRVYLFSDTRNPIQRRIVAFFLNNKRIRTTFNRLISCANNYHQHSTTAISQQHQTSNDIAPRLIGLLPSLWPRILALFRYKPEYLFRILQNNPDIFALYSPRLGSSINIKQVVQANVCVCGVCRDMMSLEQDRNTFIGVKRKLVYCNVCSAGFWFYYG